MDQNSEENKDGMKDIFKDPKTDEEISGLVNDIIFDLKTNINYKDFFASFNAASVENFINHYAFQKAKVLKNGENFLQMEEKLFLNKKYRAELRLWEIQQKKLFNLQCQWRSEIIKIPEVEISFDFEYWGKNIENCPFLDAINGDEFDLYYEYILSESFEDLDMVYSWQDYARIKENYFSEESDVPEWYYFYDSRRNTDSMLGLPDIRGEKEKFYLSLWEKEHMREGGDISADESEFDDRPDLNAYSDATVEAFMKKFEEPKLLSYFRAYQRTNKKESDPELESALNILKSTEEEVEIEGHYDWRAAVINAAYQYKQRQIAIAHRQSYQNYLYRNLYKIAHERHASEQEIRWYKELSDQMKKRIIEGRVLNGEPADLNF